MGETGKVIARDLNKGMVTVSLRRTEACAKCRACVGATDGSGKEMLIEARNDCAADVGDSVLIELKDGSFIIAALIMYGIPLAAFAAGTLAAAPVLGDVWGLVCGVLLTLFVYLAIRLNNKKFQGNAYIPVAAAKAPDSGADDCPR